MLFIIIVFVCLATAWILGFGILFIFLRQRLQKKKSFQTRTEGSLSIGLFHPYCNSGSGGERVLWVALKCLQIRYPGSQFVLYTGDTDASPEEILGKAKERFNITLPYAVEFVYLHKRKWVETHYYPYFTLLGQSLGSIYLGMEALSKFVPDVCIDTMGYTFTLPLFKYLGNCRVGCYIHSPLLTSEMLVRYSSGRSEFGYQRSSHVISQSFSLRGMMRLMYHKIFSRFYRWAGGCSDIVMVNSSWTEDHINHIWQCPSKTYKVFPPCDVDEFKGLVKDEDEAEDEDEGRIIKIISLGQFKPEKDHPLQIRILYQLRELLQENEWARIRLVIVGSCRDKEDAARVKDMEDLCKHLSVEENVEFRVDVSHEELKETLSEGLIGIHTMWNEEFGIGVVESLAAGLIVVANRSGGPLMDIVMEYDGSRNGFLAVDEHDYAEAIKIIIHMTRQSRGVIRRQAQASVDRFSERQFIKSFLEAVQVSLFR